MGKFRFSVILKNKRLNGYLMSGWIIILVTAVIQLYLCFTDRFSPQRNSAFVIMGAMLFVFLLARFGKRNFFDSHYAVGSCFGFSALSWLLWKVYAVAIALIIIYVLYNFATRRLQVVFNTDNVLFSSFPKRTVEWNELSNVIMKDGILTIDFKNNKLLQNEAEAEDFKNEKEFNEFCKNQLAGKS